MAALLNRPAFGPYMQLLGANRAYEPAALAVIAFAITWACMGLIQLVTRFQKHTTATAVAHGVPRDRRPAEVLRPEPRGARLQPRRREGRVRLLPRPVGLRQDHDAAHGRRASRRRARARSASTAATWSNLQAEPAQHRHGVPGLRAVPQHDGGAERRLRPEGRRRAAGRDRRARRRDAAAHRAARARRRAIPFQLSGGQQQRVALARALAVRPQGAAARRAALGARRQDPRLAARGDPRDPARARHHHDLRHPRPGRGAVDVRPHRGDERRRRRADRRPLRDLQPPRDALRRLVRRHAQHARGAGGRPRRAARWTIDGQPLALGRPLDGRAPARRSRWRCARRRSRSAARRATTPCSAAR